MANKPDEDLNLEELITAKEECEIERDNADAYSCSMDDRITKLSGLIEEKS